MPLLSVHSHSQFAAWLKLVFSWLSSGFVIIHTDPSSTNTSLAALGKSIKTVSHAISDEHKELQSALSKYSKAVDKVP